MLGEKWVRSKSSTLSKHDMTLGRRETCSENGLLKHSHPYREVTTSDVGDLEYRNYSRRENKANPPNTRIKLGQSECT